MLVWAATLAVVRDLDLRRVAADRRTRWCVNGPAYRDEMFHWIRTGEGREGRPAEFIPQHVLHLAGFVALSLATASAASMALGAALMNYMGFYVASLASRRGAARAPSCSSAGSRGRSAAWPRSSCWAWCSRSRCSRACGRIRYDGLRAARPYLIAAAAGHRWRTGS